MSFMEGILKQNISVWDKCIATLFVQEMKDGELPLGDFKEYMINVSCDTGNGCSIGYGMEK